jgi:hypothetical protein
MKGLLTSTLYYMFYYIIYIYTYIILYHIIYTTYRSEVSVAASSLSADLSLQSARCNRDLSVAALCVAASCLLQRAVCCRERCGERSVHASLQPQIS